MKYFLAVDIGASSGRHILGWRENNKIHIEEIYRFSNGTILYYGSSITQGDSSIALKLHSE